MQNNEELEKIINYYFNDKTLLKEAFTHPSYANEHKIDKYFTNQRLEFLGDAVLELCSSDFLYRYYNKEPEGNLTKRRAKLVCEESLSQIARDLKLDNFLLIGNGVDRENIKNNNSVMCDTLEALIGAVYIDSNFDIANKFVNNFILTSDNLNRIINDYKSIIQEKANKEKVFLSYELVKEYGPDHDKTFVVSIHYGSSIKCEGKGKSKKEAEQNAARLALNIIS
ncbi:MAG: ribonuclease III [Lachnospiraceae bacterium]|nr:ribonuclease III [Lachnospiraceae bacterium]